LPTLVAPDKIYTSTDEVVKYIIKNASKKSGKPSGTDLIEKLHKQFLDPNFSLVASVNASHTKRIYPADVLF
jgi:hypothetical protein